MRSIKTIVVMIVTAIGLAACVSPVSTADDNVTEIMRRGAAVDASIVDRSLVDDASIALAIKPRVCYTGANGEPLACCNDDGEQTCCFVFATGRTSCMQHGGLPPQPF